MVDKGNSYYLELGTLSEFPDLPLGRFCSLHQPSPSIKYYQSEHDQTDESLLLNQKHILSVNNILYVLSDDALLRAFNLTFEETENFASKTVLLNHVNEIYLKKDSLLEELTIQSYVKLLFSETKQMLLIVSKSVIYALSLNNLDRRNWMRPIKLNITEQEPIVRADVINDKLYVLRVSNTLEVWNFNNIDEIIMVSKINLSEKVEAFHLQPEINVTDFDVSSGYLAIIEKNSKKLLIFDDENLGSQFTSSLVYVGNFVNQPISLFLFANKLIVLVEGSVNFKYSLEEYELFENKSINFLRSRKINVDVKDLVIGDIYVIIAFENSLQIFPHFYIEPVQTPILINFSENVTNIGNLEFFQFFGNAKTNKTEYFTMMKEGQITIIRIEELPGIMSCSPSKDIEPGVYYNDVIFYEINCQNLNQYCNSSNINKKQQLIKINVQQNGYEQITILKQDKSILLIGLLGGVGIGVVLVSIFCYLHVRSIKKKYEKRYSSSNSSPNSNDKVERIMSLDEFPLAEKIKEDSVKLSEV